MLDLAHLLSPISAGQPAGPDLSYDPSLHELDNLVRGKPETQFSAAEPPVWSQVATHALELFDRTKDLRAAIALARAQLELGGLPGLADGLELTAEMLALFWPGLHPDLDPELEDPALPRLSVISSFATVEGVFNDPWQFVSRARRAPIASSNRLGSVHLAECRAAAQQAASTGETESPELSKINAVFRDTPPEFLSAIVSACDRGSAQLTRIEQVWKTYVRVEHLIGFDSLISVFRETKKQVLRYVSPEVVGGLEEAANVADSDLTPGTTSIRSRDDVVRALDAICLYYERVEPSSPVLTILQHAKGLIGKNFGEILAKLAPDSSAQIKL